jgi:hypothetical protein
MALDVKQGVLMVMKAVIALLMFWTTAASAEVDAYFSNGVLGAKWGARLDEVRAIYPGGTTWPNGLEQRNGELVYSVSTNVKVLALEIPISLVQFTFSRDNALNGAFLYFRYEDREAALYGIALALGQDYSIRDEADARTFKWKPGTASFAKFEVGNGPQFPWSFLGVWSVPKKTENRNGR